MGETGKSIDEAPTVETPSVTSGRATPESESQRAASAMGRSRTSRPRGAHRAGAAGAAAGKTAGKAEDQTKVTWTGAPRAATTTSRLPGADPKEDLRKDRDTERTSEDASSPGGDASGSSDGGEEHKHDEPEATRSRFAFLTSRRDPIMFALGALLALVGAAAAVFGVQALVSANRDSEAGAARAAAFEEVEAERTDEAEAALGQIFSVIDVTDAVSDVLEAGNSFRQAADQVIEVTNQAVALEDQGKPDEASALMADQGAAAFAAAAEAQQRFHEALTRLQELVA